MAPHAHATSTLGCPSPGLVSVDGRTYPLRSAHVRARAEAGLALSTLAQAFHNPHSEALEVVYTMPLPAEGAVLGYTFTIGERIVRGEIEVREKADRRYLEALYNGLTAGILEQDRPDTFLQRLGNVPANTDVRVEIEILQPLEFVAGEGPAASSADRTNDPSESAARWVYRFPTVVGVRYQGAPGRVPDAKRLDADRDADGGIPARFGLQLTVADEIPGTAGVSSSSHAIVAMPSADGMSVRLAEDARLDRDLVVRWAAAKSEVGMRVVEGRGAGSDDGRYALVTITPPAADATAYPRDLTVLLDASGSMTGEPLALAKDVVEGLLRSLGEGDRFEVLSFSNDVRKVTRKLLRAEPGAIERVIREVRAIQAGGGTEMDHALGEALRPLREGSQRQVVLVSDGQIGFEDKVIAKVRQMPARVRVHVVGIGAAPNRSLTRFLARAGRGVELLANDGASAAECAKRLRAATSRPVLTEVEISGRAVCGAAPAKPRDVLAGQPLVMAVELRSQGGTLDLSGLLVGSKWGWRIEIPAADAAAGAPGTTIASTPLPIGALYGREAIADLEADLCRQSRDSQAIDRKIEALGLRHRITSRRTSLVAICEEPTTDPNAPRRREKLAVELPAGVSAEGVGLFETDEMSALGFGPSLMGAMRVQLTRGTFSGPAGAFRGDAEATLARLSASVIRRQDADATPAPLSALVIRREGNELTIEFEVPEEGFVLPSDKVTVKVGKKTLGTGLVVVEKSAAPGPHPRGVLVRLTLRLEGGKSWPERASIEFDRSGASPGGRAGDHVTIEYA